MNTVILITILKKDLMEVLKNKAVIAPMAIVPVILLVLLPVGIVLATRLGGLPVESAFTDPELAGFLSNMPQTMKAAMAGASATQQMLILMFGYMLAPMFLVFPIMYASIIAAESFAGEKERKTLEALLYTATSDRELFTGKLLAGFVTSVAITWLMFLVYTIVLNALGWADFGRLWFPLPAWYGLILWVAPALSLITIAITVFISARSQTFMEAYQLSGVLVVFVIVLLAGQITGVLYLTPLTGFLIGLVLWGVALLLIYAASSKFTRPLLIK